MKMLVSCNYECESAEERDIDTGGGTRPVPVHVPWYQGRLLGGGGWKERVGISSSQAKRERDHIRQESNIH